MVSALSTSKRSAGSLSTDTATAMQLAYWIAALLLASGCLHLAMFAMHGTTWHGPLSIRKPALFGISGGMTTWSIAWLMAQLRSQKFDSFLANSLAIGLLVEVALITLQYWRGVASHFNHSTTLDAAIEFTMLGLIVFVSFGIFYLALRTIWLRDLEPSMAIAIRGGMWLIALSCLLGIMTTVLGEVSISLGRSSELWGRAGVLKFPHGVALHAIQLLPFVAWLARRLRVSESVRIVKSTLASQVLFLLYAIWQTGQGRDRFDWDTIGAGILGMAVLFGLFPALALAQGCIRYVFRKT